MKKLLLCLGIVLMFPMAVNGTINLGIKMLTEYIQIPLVCTDSLGIDRRPDSMHVITMFDGAVGGAAPFTIVHTTYPFTSAGFDTVILNDDTTYFFIDQIQDIDGSPTAARYNLAIDIILYTHTTGGIANHNRAIVQVIEDSLNTSLQFADAATSSRQASYTQPTGFLAATFPGGTIANTTNILLNLDNLTGDFDAADFGVASLDGKGNWNIDKTGYALTLANWNVGKSGYSLTQVFPTNFADLAITITSGEVDAKLDLTNDVSGNLVAGNFAAASLDGKGNWNIGKSGYALTLADWNVNKTGYSLTLADWNVGKSGYALTLADWNVNKTGYTLSSAGDDAVTAAVKTMLRTNPDIATGGRTVWFGSVNQASGATATRFIVDGIDLTKADEYYRYMLLEWFSGALKGEYEVVTRWATTNDSIVTEAFSAAPADNDSFTLAPFRHYLEIRDTANAIIDSINNLATISEIETNMLAELDSLMMWAGWGVGVRSRTYYSSDSDRVFIFPPTGDSLWYINFIHLGGAAGDPPDSTRNTVAP